MLLKCLDKAYVTAFVKSNVDPIRMIDIWIFSSLSKLGVVLDLEYKVNHRETSINSFSSFTSSLVSDLTSFIQSYRQ